MGQTNHGHLNTCVSFPASEELQLEYNLLSESQRAMNSSLEQTLIDVWRQVLVQNATVVELGGKRYSVRTTPRKGLRQGDFVFDGNEIRGLEQNPETKSRWAQMARAGVKVMQFPCWWTVRGECRGWEQMNDVLQCEHAPLAGLPRTQIKA
jgi:hypothetical protein